MLLTGAGGSIGAHFLEHILSQTDWRIICLDSFRHKGEFDRIRAVCKDSDRHRVTTIAHDLNAPLSERQIDKLGRIDYVLNLASLSDVQASIDDPVPFVTNNFNMMMNVLELGRKLKPSVFLHFSTDEVYGPALKDQAHKEWSTILPSNPYAASKAIQEAIAIAYWRSYGLPLVITNTMNNFGEMQQASKYPVKIQKAVQAGKKVTVHASSDGQIGTRYYLHSKNAADGVLFILKREPYLHKPGEIDKPDRYNIVGDVQLDNLELAKKIAELMGQELDYELEDFHSKQPGHDLHYGLDGSKLQKLGWEPPLDFEESLKQTIEWQQENSEWIDG